MTCPHLPGWTGFPWHLLSAAGLAVALALGPAPAAEAAPKTTSSTNTSNKATAQRTTQRAAQNKPKPAARQTTATRSGTAGKRKATAPVCPPAGKKASASRGRKRAPAAACKSGSAAAKAGAAGAAATSAGAATLADTPATEAPVQGLRLPLMLRTVPSLPDNPAALQVRLDSIVAAQGEGATNAQVSGVRQLAPSIYAFSLQCADAEQCQRLRLAIEREIDWVAGLQLDERRHIPRAPDRNDPSAR